MKIIVKTEPVCYLIHNDIEINAKDLVHFFEMKAWGDRSIFNKDDPKDMAILDFIRKEAENRDERDDLLEEEEGGVIILEWRQRNDHLIETMIGKIESLIKQAETAHLDKTEV